MLPPETEKLWQFASQQPTLAGSVLVGGTALALHLGHRISEDLDLAFLQSKLPRHQVDVFRQLAAEDGFRVDRSDDEAALDEFIIAGMDLYDYQQDFLVNNEVKLSCFVPDDPVIKVLAPGVTTGPRLATVAELFKTKALVSASRSKTRDWLDLYLLMNEHGFTIDDYASAFRDAGVPSHVELGLARLCSGRPAIHDEGYRHLLHRAPSLEEMRDFFISQRDHLETSAAAVTFRTAKS